MENLFFLRPEIKKINSILKNKTLRRFILVGALISTRLAISPAALIYKIKLRLTSSSPHFSKIKELISCEALGIYDFQKNDFTLDISNYSPNNFKSRPIFPRSAKIFSLINKTNNLHNSEILLYAFSHGHYPTIFYLEKELSNFFRMCPLSTFLNSCYHSSTISALSSVADGFDNLANKKIHLLRMISTNLLKNKNYDFLESLILKSIEKKDALTFGYYVSNIYHDYQPPEFLKKIESAMVKHNGLENKFLKHYYQFLIVNVESKNIDAILPAGNNFIKLKI